MPLRPAPIRSPANLLELDYRSLAGTLATFNFPIYDVHSHLSGAEAAQVYEQAAELYGIGRVYSMTPLEELTAVRQVLGDRVRFIAVPNILAADRLHAVTVGYAERLRAFADAGVTLAKFWSAPRGIDFAEQAGAPANLFRLDAPHVRQNMELAIQLGMRIMVHVSDPDTWFATHYVNESKYGSKLSQYGPLESCLREYREVPFIAAHLGGWPENLEFLDQLLTRHENLSLDTSATKWMVRELSKHAPATLRQFFEKWHARLLFGSDIVTRDNHLRSESADPEEAKAATPEAAFDLYASRYWALRTLFESNYDGPSPIADPDLPMIDPGQFGPDAAPRLRGFQFPESLLKSFYHDTPARWLEGTVA